MTDSAREVEEYAELEEEEAAVTEARQGEPEVEDSRGGRTHR